MYNNNVAPFHVHVHTEALEVLHELLDDHYPSECVNVYDYVITSHKIAIRSLIQTLTLS